MARGNSNLTFLGPENAIIIFQQRKIYNLLIDRHYSMHRFLMRNLRNGDVVVAYETEDNMFLKMRPAQAYAYYEIIQCQHFLHFFRKRTELFLHRLL